MSYLRDKIVMPEIGPIRWRKDGYGVQEIILPSLGTMRLSPDGWSMFEDDSPPQDSIQRGYVKIWRDGPERRVVDRALTVETARRRITQLKQAESEA